MQRVQAIDDVFQSVERVYLDVSYRRNVLLHISRPSDKVKVWHLNFFLHFWLIMFLGLKGKCLYVHSVYKAQFILPLYFLRPVFTEMHGIVPEELASCGSKIGTWFFDIIEACAVARSYALITVTRAMAEHLRKKHRLSNIKTYVFPNMRCGESQTVRSVSASDDVYTIIYAGGTDHWQNADMMLDVIGKLKEKFKFIILTGDPEWFRTRFRDKGLEGKVELLSVSRSEVEDYYARADFGFLLRNDHPVNRVACPTKLTEYLSAGVLPIVIQPNIGDFAAYGCSYLLLDDLLAMKLPDVEGLERMREANRAVIRKMESDSVSTMEDLRAEVLGICQPKTKSIH